MATFLDPAKFSSEMLVYPFKAKHAAVKRCNGRRYCVDVYSGTSNRSKCLGNLQSSVTLIAANKNNHCKRMHTCVISMNRVQDGETICESKAE